MAENNVNTTVVETPEMEKRFHDEYTVKMIRSGRLTTLIAALLTFLPALYLWFGLGIKPTWSQIGSGWAIILSSYFLIYFFEPLGFYPQMGLSGIYVGYLAGNIPSVRLPAMLAARAACGVEAGTKRGELIGTIAIGVSVFTNLFFVTLAAVSGVYILEVLPPLRHQRLRLLPARHPGLRHGPVLVQAESLHSPDLRDLHGHRVHPHALLVQVPQRHHYQPDPGLRLLSDEKKKAAEA